MKQRKGVQMCAACGLTLFCVFLPSLRRGFMPRRGCRSDGFRSFVVRVLLRSGGPRRIIVDRTVETDFGQTDFGHRYPTDFGQTDFGQTDFGQTDLGQNRLWPNRLWPNRVWPNRLWPNRPWPKPTLAKPTLAKAILAQAISLKVAVCFGVVRFLLHPRQTSMGRRGWQAVEVPQGWFNVIRGPRPPSVRWPQAQSSHQPVKVVRNVSAATRTTSGDRSVQGRWRQGRPRFNPDVALESARKRVVGLEAAISAMLSNGLDEKSAEVRSLQDSLTKAKRSAQEAPLEVQMKGVQEFIERAQKRLAAHDAVRTELEKELVEGQARLRMQVEAMPQPQPVAQDLPPPEWVTEIQRLRAEVANCKAGRMHFHPKSISSNDTFIQTRFHPMTLSSKHDFIQ